jgi:hexosaminidase
MYWPRAVAIAETGWSMPENKCLSENLCQNVSSETASRDFRTRALKAIELLQARGYNTFDLANEYGERKLAQTGLEHKAKGKSVKYLNPIQEWYPAAGEKTFTDGVIGGWTYSDKRWQGFLSEIDVVIDLEQVQTISYVGGTFMQLKGPGVFMPQKVEISVSEDGEDFELIATVWNDVSTEIPDLLFRSFDTITSTKARYVRYHAYRSPKRGFIFLDEIIVN